MFAKTLLISSATQFIKVLRGYRIGFIRILSMNTKNISIKIIMASRVDGPIKLSVLIRI